MLHLHRADRADRLIGALAAVLAVPSVWPEPFGLVGLEAAARGVPAVAFDTGGIRQWLHHQISGLLVPPSGGHAALATAFAARLHDIDGAAFTEARGVEYAAALQNDMPRSRRALYCMSRDVFVTTKSEMATFNGVFAEVFGSQGGTDRYRDVAPVPATAVAGMR